MRVLLRSSHYLHIPTTKCILWSRFIDTYISYWLYVFACRWYGMVHRIYICIYLFGLISVNIQVEKFSTATICLSVWMLVYMCVCANAKSILLPHSHMFIKVVSYICDNGIIGLVLIALRAIFIYIYLHTHKTDV